MMKYHNRWKPLPFVVALALNRPLTTRYMMKSIDKVADLDPEFETTSFTLYLTLQVSINVLRHNSVRLLKGYVPLSCCSMIVGFEVRDVLNVSGLDYRIGCRFFSLFFLSLEANPDKETEVMRSALASHQEIFVAKSVFANEFHLSLPTAPRKVINFRR